MRGTVCWFLFSAAAGMTVLPAAPVDTGVRVGYAVARDSPDSPLATGPGDALRLTVLSPEELCGLDPAPPDSPGSSPGATALLLLPDGEPDACWLAGLVSLASRAVPHGAVYVIGDAPDRSTSPEAYAYLLKRSAITLRAADAEAVILIGPLSPASADWMAEVARADPSAYFEGLSATPESLENVLAGRDRWWPGLPVWAVERAAPGPGEVEVRAARLLARGADAAILLVRDEIEGGALEALASAIPVGARPAGHAGESARTDGRLQLIGGYAGGLRLWIVPPHEGRLVLPTGLPPADRVERLDPRSGSVSPLTLRSGRTGGSVRLAAAAEPTLVRVHAADDPRTESVEISRHVGLTAAQIVAREREVRARQALRLTTFAARARVAYHFTLASFSESVDVITENDAFGRDDSVEYRQTALFVNGHAWKGDPPRFPFIAPERVKQIPLEVSLHEGYEYELTGEDKQAGQSCYRISFVPREPDAEFRGVIWIDRDSFERVRLDLVRLAPAAPVTSDTLTQWFRPIESFRLMTDVEGQMTFSALGHDAVLERSIHFEKFRLDPPEFEDERLAALASDDPVYRDSLRDGLVELVPGADGAGRTERRNFATSNTLLIGGWSGSVDNGLGGPFAAINWFDLDFRGSGVQMDLAWAGLFAGLSVTWPESAHRWQTSLELRLAGLPSSDNYVGGAGRDYTQDLKRLDETARVHVRRRLTPQLGLSLEPHLAYMSHSRKSGTSDDFLLPQDTLMPGFGVRLDYQRNGFRLGLWGDVERRLDWGPYGLPSDDAARNDVRDTAMRYGIQFNKNVYSRAMDRLSIDLDLWEGRNLDRFSAFRVRGLEGVQLRGFSSAGLRLSRGATTSLAFAFRPLGNLRFELLAGGGLFESRDDYGEGWQYAYGGGLAVTFPGPAGTLFRIRGSRGLESSLPVDGQTGSLRLTVIKTFRGWWPWPQKDD